MGAASALKQRRRLDLQGRPASVLDPNITVFVCFLELSPVGWSGENLQSAMTPTSPPISFRIKLLLLTVWFLERNVWSPKAGLSF